MLRNYFDFVILLIIILSTKLAFASPQMALLDDNHHRVNVGSVGSYYIDASGELTANDLSSDLLRKSFVPLTNDFQQFGLVKGNIWIKVDIAQEFASPQPSVLHIKVPRAQEVDVYSTQPNNPVSLEMGNARPFANRQILHPDYIIPLPTISTPVFTVYIKVSSRVPINLLIEVKTLSELSKDIQRDTTITGVLIGLLVLLFFSNVFFFAKTKHPMYLLYSLLLVGIAFLHLSLHGIIYQLLPNQTGLQERIYNFASLTCVASITAFTRFYLDTKLHLPRIDRLLILIILANLTLALIYTLAPQELKITYLTGSAFVTLVSLLAIAIYAVITRTPYAPYYLIARLVLTFGHTLWVLSAYGLVSLPFWYEWGLTTSIIMEALIHFIGIMMRYAPITLHQAAEKTFTDTEFVVEVSLRIKRQTTIIDFEKSQKEPNKDVLRRAYKNLSNLSERLSFLKVIHSEHAKTAATNSPVNLQNLIDQALGDFYQLDSGKALIVMQHDETVQWEIYSQVAMIRHLYLVIMEELHHPSDQALNIESYVLLSPRDLQKHLSISVGPLPSSIDMESGRYFGARYLKEFCEKVGGQAEIDGSGRSRSMKFSIPISAHKIEPSKLALKSHSEELTIVALGNDSDLTERAINHLHTKLYSISHVDKALDLHHLLDNRSSRTNFVILLFEDQSNFGASELSGLLGSLLEGDSCLLISNNVKMSTDFSNALGFDSYIYSAYIETKLISEIERLQRESFHSTLPRVKRKN